MTTETDTDIKLLFSEQISCKQIPLQIFVSLFLCYFVKEVIVQSSSFDQVSSFTSAVIQNCTSSD